MKTNIENVLEKDQNLSELDDRADALQEKNLQVEQKPETLTRKFWLDNIKVLILVVVIGIIILGSITGY